MRVKTALLLSLYFAAELCSAQISVSAGNSLDHAGNVITLTDLNFDALVNSSRPWMIDIYAPWQVNYGTWC